jgi:hypothetical protein
MVAGWGTHPLGGAMVRHRRRVGSGGRRRPRGAPAARDRRGGEGKVRCTDGRQKKAGAVLTWEVESAVALGLDFMAARCPRRLAPDKE